MSKTTDDKTILITVRDEDFDVKFNGDFTYDEAAQVFVGCLQHLEEQVEELLDKTVSNMVH